MNNLWRFSQQLIAHPLFKFAVVGVIGCVVDIAVLYLGLACGLGLYLGRFVFLSFCLFVFALFVSESLFHNYSELWLPNSINNNPVPIARCISPCSSVICYRD